MNSNNYLIVHKDHTMDLSGINSGAEMATLFLARFLVRQGKRVVVCAQLKDGQERVEHGVEFWDLGPSFDVRSSIIRAREELGHYHLISAGRARPIFEVRGEDACLSRTLISHESLISAIGIQPSLLCELVDQVICVSQAQKDIFISAGADERKVHVVHNGVDLDLFAAGDVEARDYNKLVFVGALVEDKGIHVLIAAYAALVQKYPDLTLDIYGSAGLWGRVETFDKAAIEAKFPGLKLHGAVAQHKIAKAYQTAGLCVVPSVWFDCFPLTSIEAQATGCPVVTFDIGGLAEGVLPGAGLVLEEVSVESLALGINSLLAQPNQLKQMSKVALEKARSYYRWERVANSVIRFAEEAATSVKRTGEECTEKPFGMLTTWNQECGLATYADYMLGAFDEGTYCVFAEEASDARLAEDQRWVFRCWDRNSADYTNLERAVEESGIGLLYLNVHARFFHFPSFSRFLDRLRSRRIKIIAHLHSVFTVDKSISDLISCVDQVVVHTPENRLEVIANGASAEQVLVVEHGVNPQKAISLEERQLLRKELSLPLKGSIFCSFGFIQPHKGIEGLIEAIAILRKINYDVHGVIAGSSHAADPNSVEYLAQLKQLTINLGLAEYIHFTDRFISNDEVTRYLQAADVVFMNYQSQHYEASGACALAVGAGAVVATSIAPPFAAFGDAVWHISSGYPAATSLAALLSNEALRKEIQINAFNYSQRNSWACTRKKIEKIFQKLAFKPADGRKLSVMRHSIQEKQGSAQIDSPHFYGLSGFRKLEERTLPTSGDYHDFEN